MSVLTVLRYHPSDPISLTWSSREMTLLCDRLLTCSVPFLIPFVLYPRKARPHERVICVTISPHTRTQEVILTNVLELSGCSFVSNALFNKIVFILRCIPQWSVGQMTQWSEWLKAAKLGQLPPVFTQRGYFFCTKSLKNPPAPSWIWTNNTSEKAVDEPTQPCTIANQKGLKPLSCHSQVG